VVVQSQGPINGGDLSQDARWVAYASNESGEWEVYVTPFLAKGGGRVKVTAGGGGMPHWSGDGRRLVYRSRQGAMAVDMAVVDGRLRPGVPRPLFEGSFYGGLTGYEYGNAGLENFTASRDGKTFVLQQTYDGSTQQDAVIVFNWFQELQRLAPVNR
jgi:eukaryotic-like serine/threonine-protein kinase